MLGVVLGMSSGPLGADEQKSFAFSGGIFRLGKADHQAEAGVGVRFPTGTWKLVADAGETVSAFYVSNVEFYLLRAGVFSDYVDNVRALPVGEESLFIRAYFSYGYPHPAALSGHRSVLVRQRMPRFLRFYDEGAYRSYWDVATLDFER